MIFASGKASRSRLCRSSSSGTGLPSRLRRLPTNTFTLGNRPSGVINSAAIRAPCPSAASSNASNITTTRRAILPVSSSRRRMSAIRVSPRAISKFEATLRAQSSRVFHLTCTTASKQRSRGVGSSLSTAPAATAIAFASSRAPDQDGDVLTSFRRPSPRVQRRLRLASARPNELVLVLPIDTISALPLQDRRRRSVRDPQIPIGSRPTRAPPPRGFLL